MAQQSHSLPYMSHNRLFLRRIELESLPVSGTKRTTSDVRISVAIGDKSDVTQTTRFSRK